MQDNATLSTNSLEATVTNILLGGILAVMILRWIDEAWGR